MSVDFAGKLQVLVAGLHREGVGVEPLEQGQVQGCACVAVLGRMDMGVHHSRHEELAVGSSHMDVRKIGLECLKYSCC